VNFTISEVGAFSPAKYTIIGWEVPDIVVTVRELTDKGVSFSRYPHFQQDDLGIWTSPSGSKVAWFSDPDGNVLSLSQH
jgi:predicted enzyme related to lactoylglutathione lyase